MAGKILNLKEFGSLNKEQQDKALADFIGSIKTESLPETLKRLRAELDALELEHGATTEDMLAPHTCLQIEEDPLLKDWATSYACYRQLLSTYKEIRSNSVA